MRRIYNTVWILLTVFMLAGCATQQEKVQAQRWKDADIDGNGIMTLAEFEASKLRLAMSFSQADQNEDGFVSHDEYQHYNRPKAVRENRARERQRRIAQLEGEGHV